MMDMASFFTTKVSEGDGGVKDTGSAPEGVPSSAKIFSHISLNETGLQLQIRCRAGRGSAFVSENHLFFEFDLIADFQIFVMKLIDKQAHYPACFAIVLDIYNREPRFFI